MKKLCLPVLLAASLGSIPAALGQVVYNPFGGAPSQIPKTINPKRPLTISVGYPNPLKYKVEIKSVYFTREYPTTPASTTPAAAAPNDNTNKPEKGAFEIAHKLGHENLLTLDENAAKAKAAKEKIETLTKQYTQYKALIGELGKQYRADTWTDKLFESQIQPYAQAVFPTDYSTISGVELKTKLQLLKQLLADALEEYQTRSTDIAEEASELKTKQETAQQAKKPDAAKIKTAKGAYNKAANLAKTYSAESKDLEATADLVKEMGVRLTNESQAKELNVLGGTYVALRDHNPEGIVIQPSSIPDGKDELDLEVKLTLRSDYERPPGVALSEPQPLTATLYVVPRFRITASVGPYSGGLFDFQFSLAEDSLQVSGAPTSGGAATTHYVRRKRIVRENDSQVFDYIGATVLTHFEYRVRPGLSYALSLGAGTQATNFRFLIGPSVLFGNAQRGAITTGLLLGQVKRLSNRYKEGDLVPVALEAVPTREINKASWFVAITYNLSSTRK